MFAAWTPVIEELKLAHHGTEEASSRIQEEVRSQEEVGEAPQEVEEAQQQEGCPQASQVSQEALQEGRRRRVDRMYAFCSVCDPLGVLRLLRMCQCVCESLAVCLHFD